MKRILFILSLLFTTGLSAQNLAENGSFENTGQCPIISNDFADFLDPWYYFGLRPDYYHLGCGFPGSDSTTNNTQPFDGQGMVGLNVYGESDSAFIRDYIHGELSEPLDSGKYYRVTFYVKPVDQDSTGVGLGINNMGLLLTDSVVDTIPPNFVLDTTPQVVETQIIDQVNYWTAICGIVKAKGGETNFTIGNFKPDDETQFSTLPTASNPDRGYFLVDYVQILENDIPQLPQDTVICTGGRIDLDIRGPEVSVTWSDGVSDTTGPHYIITEPGTYSAQINNGLCNYTDTINVERINCNPCQIYAPTAFTPNGDGLNEEFMVVPNCAEEGELLSFRLKIFDRWGRKVFETDSEEVGWNGKNANYQGVYTYTLEYSYRQKGESTTEIKRGTVTLLK